MDNDKHIYVSGPGRNKAQRETLEMIMDTCNLAGLRSFSPEEDLPYIMRGAQKEAHMRSFNLRMDAIKNASVMIACLDYALPEGEEMRIIKTPSVGPEYCAVHPEEENRLRTSGLQKAGNTIHCTCVISGVAKSGALNIPDYVVAYEMAIAKASGVHVIGYTNTHKKEWGLGGTHNILFESLYGVVHGPHALVEFITALPDWGLSHFKGYV